MSREPISQEFVDRLRNMGAHDFTIEFADQFVVRYHRRDMQRVWSRGVWVGGVIGTIGGILVGYVTWAS